MGKKQKPKKVSIRSIFIISGATIAIGSLGFLGLNSLTPVNADHLVFSMPTNLYIKAINSPDKGYTFATQSAKGGKGLPLAGAREPTLILGKGSLASVHFINEDKNVGDSISKHNFNIDEFNVHSNDLEYFQTQTITFLADKEGTFQYYCSIHPEMRGTIVVE